MFIIIPLTDLDALVTSTNVPTLVPNFDPDATYVTGSHVTYSGSTRVYESKEIISGSDPGPQDDPDETYWWEYGYTNPYKAFDGIVNSQSVKTGDISYVITSTDYISAIAFINLENVASVRTQIHFDSVEVYDSGTVSLLITGSTYATSVSLSGFPRYLDSVYTITITAVDSGADTKVGEIAAGRVVDLGYTEYNSTTGIIDYSDKDADQFGSFSVLERAYSKRASISTVFPAARVDYINTVLSSIRSTPVAWIGTDNTSYADNMIIYGFYKDFSIDIKDCNYSYLGVSVEGLV